MTTEDHSATETLVEDEPASLWVLDRDRIQYRLADGRLHLGPEGLDGPVTALIKPVGYRDHALCCVVCGPADTLALFCHGGFVARTPLPHRLNESRSDRVYVGPAGERVEAA